MIDEKFMNLYKDEIEKLEHKYVGLDYETRLFGLKKYIPQLEREGDFDYLFRVKEMLEFQTKKAENEKEEMMLFEILVYVPDPVESVMVRGD